MEKYYIISWPESQDFMENKECLSVMQESNENSLMIAVPCKLYDNYIKVLNKIADEELKTDSTNIKDK